jgi:hypothetical protein
MSILNLCDSVPHRDLVFLPFFCPDLFPCPIITIESSVLTHLSFCRCTVSLLLSRIRFCIFFREGASIRQGDRGQLTYHGLANS